MDEVLWKWENGDLRDKKCVECSGTMNTDKATAITYQSKSYHAHCLITFLTKYHTASSSTSSNSAQLHILWSHAP